VNDQKTRLQIALEIEAETEQIWLEAKQSIREVHADYIKAQKNLKAILTDIRTGVVQAELPLTVPEPQPKASPKDYFGKATKYPVPSDDVIAAAKAIGLEPVPLAEGSIYKNVETTFAREPVPTSDATPADKTRVRRYAEPVITAKDSTLGRNALASARNGVAFAPVEPPSKSSSSRTAAATAARKAKQVHAMTDGKKALTPTEWRTLVGVKTVIKDKIVAIPMSGSAWDEADLLNAADDLACAREDLVICKNCNRARSVNTHPCPACKGTGMRFPDAIHIPSKVQKQKGRRRAQAARPRS
jgi:hypothetical protein